MMSRASLNKLRAAILLVLVILMAGLWWAGLETGVEDFDRNMFKPASTQDIDSVVLTSPRDTVRLALRQNAWLVNSTWDADRDMIKVFFATLLQTEVRRPVARSLRDSIATRVRQEGTQVQLFQQGALVGTFSVGGNQNRNQTWFMGSGDPYEMIIPGYRVYVGGIFELPEGGWRNKRIFDFNWRNFKKLIANYAREPKAGFEVDFVGSFFSVRDLPTDTAKLNAYLDAVSLLMADRFVKANAMTDSLSRVEPAMSIDVSDVAGRHFNLDLYTPGKTNPEVMGRLNGREWVVIRRGDLAELAWKRSYFALQPKPDSR